MNHSDYPPIMTPPPMYPSPGASSKRKPIIIFIVVLAVVFFLLLILGTLFQKTLPGLGGRVALIEVKGVIYDVSPLIRELHVYRDDPTVKAIVVRIDSGGGSAAASQELYEELNKVRHAFGKPVVASLGSVAASGGYYIACASDEIVANPATLTGSIGVIMNMANFETLIQKIGIRYEVIKSGEHKDIGSFHRQMTEEERDIVQEVVTDCYEQFVDDIYYTRSEQLKAALLRSNPFTSSEDGPTSDPVRQYIYTFADGRFFTGRMAKDYGLVDHLGNLQDAVNRAGQLAGMGVSPRILRKKKRISFMDFLRGDVHELFGHIGVPSPLLEYRAVHP